MEVTKSKEPTQGAKEEQKPKLDSAIIDELMKGYQRPEDMTGPGGILEQLTKRVYERILNADMTHYLVYQKGQAAQQQERVKSATETAPAKRPLAPRALPRFFATMKALSPPGYRTFATRASLLMTKTAMHKQHPAPENAAL
jgi:hypothetical protein